jgi:hypothetical protein
VFLDVKGAFLSVHIERLVWDLRRKGMPVKLTSWIEARLLGQRMFMIFAGYRILYNFCNAWIGSSPQPRAQDAYSS